jgi:hypothetical protein
MHCRRDQRGLVAAALREVCNVENQADARHRVRQVIEKLTGTAPKVCALLEARRGRPDRVLRAARRTKRWSRSYRLRPDPTTMTRPRVMAFGLALRARPQADTRSKCQGRLRIDPVAPVEN